MVGYMWNMGKGVSISPKHFFRTLFFRNALYLKYVSNKHKTQSEADPIGQCLHLAT